MDMNQTIEIISEPTNIIEWLRAIAEISYLLYIFPFFAFFALLVLGYSLATNNILDGFIVASFFSILIAISMVALQILAFYYIVIILTFLVLSVLLKLGLGATQ